MTIQQVVAELENIKEQTLNNSKITINDVIEAIEDVITDCKDDSMDFTFDLEDDYASYERETDFTELEIQIDFNPVAQLVEHLAFNQQVVGSIPTRITMVSTTTLNKC